MAKNSSGANRWRVGELEDAAKVAGATAVIGMFVALGIDGAAQEISQLGFANVLFGAKLGLLGLDWSELGKSALAGAAVGAVLPGVVGVAGAIVGAGSALKGKLRSRGADASEDQPAPRRPRF